MATVGRMWVQLAVLAIWVVTMFAFIGGKRKSSNSEPTRRRDTTSRVGIAIQAVAFVLSWVGPWWFFMRTPNKPSLPLWAAVTAIVLALIGARFCVAAVRTLGKQWSLTARVLEQHELVTSGPYSTVRNPIYTGMWALQIATTIAFSSWIWWGLVPISTAIYYIGTMVRVRREENLLREQFGPAFEDYTRRVPALLPLGGRGAGDQESGANA